MQKREKDDASILTHEASVNDNTCEMYAFFVGHCEEWPENRKKEGDIAIHRAYLQAGLPPENVLYIKDRDCTKSNCQKQLVKFLKRCRANSTLLFYYAGHGKPEGFCTWKAPKNSDISVWPFEQVVATIDSLFKGNRVLYLLDCCAAGNLCHVVHRLTRPTFSAEATHKQYVCLQSSPPYMVTRDDGVEWVVSRCWIKCMKEGSSLAAAMEFLSDRTALVLGDQFLNYVSDDVDILTIDDRKWIPRLKDDKSFNKSAVDVSQLSWKKLEIEIPEDAKVSEDWMVGDYAFFKHIGGPVITSDQSEQVVPPGWLRGKIQNSSDGGQVRMEIEYVPRNIRWCVDASRDALLNDLYMAQVWMIPDGLQEVLLALSKHYKYIDHSHETSQLAPGTICPIVWDDGKSQEARIVDWRDFDWETFMTTNSAAMFTRPPFGPHVPIRLLAGESPLRLLSLERIQLPNLVVRPFLESVEETMGKEEEWARRSLVASLESCGKSICHAGDVFGKSKLKAYWPEEERWYKAKPLDPQTVSLEILTTHMQFTIPGPYCPLLYEDGDRVLSPLHYIRKKS
eukprot:Nitzschia sp. Nitz4//scaffold119_size111653//6161//7858//NITZ4_004174-RA/size111653-processed-gene-0.26-mRNA-1//-1//CDS//3329533788//667//frame0